jgi:hypothetical protein
VISAREIADTVTRNRSKRTIVDLAERMVHEGIDFEDFFDEVDALPGPLRWYMTWTLSHYVERVGQIGPRDQRRIWQALVDSESPGMRRDLWRALSFVDVDEDIAGHVFEAAIETITASRQATAARAHAMYVARNIARPHAELRRELTLVLEGLSRHESAAIRNRKQSIMREFAPVRRE